VNLIFFGFFFYLLLISRLACLAFIVTTRVSLLFNVFSKFADKRFCCPYKSLTLTFSLLRLVLFCSVVSLVSG
jgi:hypothetical protein